MKNKSRIISLLLCLCFTMVNALAQQKTVSGIVTDETNQPMPGVAVTVPGTTMGVITDIDGNYHIKLNDGEKLHFSFIGYENQDIDPAGRSQINVQMQPE